MGLEGGQLLYLYIIIEREKEERDTVLYKAIIIMQADNEIISILKR